MEICQAARDVATAVDWECSVHTLLRERNLGCGPAVASAISWFFEQVETGIILEDDCVPSQSFYRFCEELLTYYAAAPRIMHISGHNFQYGIRRGDASYYFSSWTHNGGWATWRRAWQHYDFTLVPEQHRHDVWDGQWRLTVDQQHGVAILPNVNLVTNIGYGAGATHTQANARAGFLEAHEIGFPLRHPSRIVVDKKADQFTYYANIRNVPDLRLIPLYRAWDFVVLHILKIAKLILRFLSQEPGKYEA